MLQPLLVVVDEGAHQAGAAAEPAEHRPLADPGGLGDLLHRDRRGASFGDELRGGVEQPDPIRGSIGPLVAPGQQVAADERDPVIVTAVHSDEGNGSPKAGRFSE
ncbi:hypothetical protein GOARA_061_00820 [Gordonia araii NBRC 100433]|uniref:Uncharacterized protein n=1 Tax=Gordonia araii NBRC 100433 TaxID=1073574 RepID=G7H468_9ACTN|nr:hypothetical protein GOARA_061_00820 [Gordonia araii NBRC 100433]